MNILIVDDDQKRIDWFFSRFEKHKIAPAKTVEGVKGMIEWDDYDVAFFDHDLGEGGDMIELVRWIIAEGHLKNTKIVVHSMNPVGASNIVAELTRSGLNAIAFPYSRREEW